MFYATGETAKEWRAMVDALTTSKKTRDYCDWWEEQQQLDVYFDYTDNPDDSRPVVDVWRGETRYEDVAGNVWIWRDANGGWYMQGRYVIGGEITETNRLHFQTLTQALCTMPDAFPMPEYLWCSICDALRGL